MLAAASHPAGDVDGDADFDANDSFLIHLTKLAGTDTQIDQSKGASSLAASQIRSNIDQLGSRADVDGDGDFDANDSFLIHLTKLAGTDSQLDQSKGASPLTATEIRTNIDDLANPGTTLTLRESDGFLSTQLFPVELGGTNGGTRTIQIELETTFDTSDQIPAVEDLFQIYLVDSADSGTTLLDRGDAGTSLLTLTSEESEFAPGIVRYNGQSVEIDVTSVTGATTGDLLFQLINSDADDGTEVSVRSITNTVDPVGVTGPAFTSSGASLAAVGPAVNLSGYQPAANVTADFSDIRFHESTGLYRAELRVHAGGTGTGRQVVAILDDLPAGVTLANTSGTDSGGAPYLNLSNAIPAGGLATANTSDPVLVEFSDPTLTAFSIKPRILTAGPNRAPAFDTVAPITIMPGDSLDLNLNATDPDGDPVTFTFTPASDMPTIVFNGNGSMRIAPTPNDVGEYSFDVHASDGSLTTSQTVSVEVQSDSVRTTRISGVVLNTDESPLAGVPIEVGRFQTVTGADGAFTLELPSFTVPTEEFDISVPLGDVHFDPFSAGDKTIPLHRAGYDTTTGTSPANPRQHPNLVSSFLDASVVYGPDADRAAALRLNDGSGKLKTSAGNLLPLNDSTFFPGGPLENENNSQRDPATLFGAGDVRANENPALLSLQTLFVREHNRRADELAVADPLLTGEELYQQARRWVSALLQHITYDEFLPLLLGENALPAYSGYDDGTDPSIGALFSGAAFRYGHSMAGPDLDLLGTGGTPLAGSPLSMRDAFFNPDPIKDDGIEPVLRGMAEQLVEELDSQVIDDLRNFLFGPPGSGGLDLVSINIQRGRDLGLPSYNDTRRELGLTPVNSFADITSDAAVQSKLSSVYANVEAIDLWVGGLAEDHVAGAIVGETFRTIIADQFERTRDGDRFWYENSQFNTSDLAAIRATTLSSLIVQNTSITSLPTSVFTTQAVPGSFGDGGSSVVTAPSEFRSVDGADNNADTPDLGQAGTNLLANFTPGYADGISTPAGSDRPGARDISNGVFAQSGSVPIASGLTNMFAMWGQLITHDTNLTPGGTDDTLRIHGEMEPGSDVYPFVAEKLPLVLEHPVLVGFNNVIDRPIYLPVLDVAGGTTIDPSQNTMVMQEIAAGEMAVLDVTAGSLEDREGNMFNGVLSITEVPRDLTPAALPGGLEFPTVRYLPAVALVSYLIDRSHSWYSAYLKIFVLVQGTYTPQVIRHDWRTKRSSPARRTDGSSAEPDDDHALGRQTLTRWVQFPRRGGSVLQADLQSPKDCRSCNFPKSIARECEPQTCSNAKTENSNGEHASQRCSQTKLPY